MFEVVGIVDPYTVCEGGPKEPPTSWKGRLRHLGPSMVPGSIVGSGEIILTSVLGAAAMAGVVVRFVVF